MSELFKQFGLLILDYLIGFFVSAAMDMRHSVRYRVHERSRRRNCLDQEEEPQIVSFKNKKFKVVCNCSDLLILKEILEMPLGNQEEAIVVLEEKNNTEEQPK